MIDVATGEDCRSVIVGGKGGNDDFFAIGVSLIPLDPEGHAHFCAEGLHCDPQPADDGGYFRCHGFS